MSTEDELHNCTHATRRSLEIRRAREHCCRVLCGEAEGAVGRCSVTVRLSGDAVVCIYGHRLMHLQSTIVDFDRHHGSSGAEGRKHTNMMVSEWVPGCLSTVSLSGTVTRGTAGRGRTGQG